jgi:hypothetical protein
MATFTPFSAGDTVTSIDRVFASAWTNNTNTLTTNHFSSSAQYITSSATSSGAFFMDIFNAHPINDSAAEVQYSIAFGHRAGSGSRNYSAGSGGNGFSAAKSIYNQYRNLVYGGDETQNFSFNGHTPDHIYVLNVNRARYKNAIRMGNQFNLRISGSTQNSLLNLTDDSVTNSGSANAIRPGVGREFNLVSGSNGIRLGDNTTFVTNSGSYGLIYPDAGLIVLNGDALDATAANNGLALSSNLSSDVGGDNPRRLQEALIKGKLFQLDSQEDIASKFYFVRVQNQDFNYTTNDSFTLNDGTLRFDSMIDNPQTYITTVGLYNDAQDLLAVAKLSQPLPKDFTKEALIKVKLDY